MAGAFEGYKHLRQGFRCAIACRVPIATDSKIGRLTSFHGIQLKLHGCIFVYAWYCMMDAICVMELTLLRVRVRLFVYV